MTKFRILIVGQGYVGLPLAMAAATAGHSVLGLELDSKRVDNLNNGLSHIEDISHSVLRENIRRDSYRATLDPSEAANSEIVIICVPTPLDQNRNPDLTALTLAVKTVAPFLKSKTLLISESTSYPGTARDLIFPLLQEALGMQAENILIASAPERVDPGNESYDHSNTPRLVAGLTAEATQIAADFYRTFTSEVVVVSSPEVAEAAKLLENTFRQVNIALANEVAMICHKLGVNVREVIDAAATKPYGFMKFTPGAGVGGHCIPVDPSYLSWRAKQAGAPARFIDLANEVNLQMPSYVVDRLLALLEQPHDGGKVLILGVAYKPGVGDIRETPADGVADALESRGLSVAWHDPLVEHWRGSESSLLDRDYLAAIVVTAQPGLEVGTLLKRQIPILDCTGKFQSSSGVHQL